MQRGADRTSPCSHCKQDMVSQQGFGTSVKNVYSLAYFKGAICKKWTAIEFILTTETKQGG